MKGIDVSHWQGTINWSKVADDKIEYAIIKCSESVGWKDSMFEQNKAQARKAGVLCGYYHFARGTDAKKEAQWFLDSVGDIKKGELIALDYEIKKLSDPAKWCREWLDYVEKKVSFKPLLYTYHSFLKTYDWTEVSSGNFGLWAARYGLQQQKPNSLFKPATGSWQFWAIWQYCSKGKVDGVTGNCDLNTTTMDMETLMKYGSQEDSESSVCECEEIEEDLKDCKKDNAEMFNEITTLNTKLADANMKLDKINKLSE